MPTADFADLDLTVADVGRNAASWCRTGLDERLAMLERLLAKVPGAAGPMVAAAAAAKGYAADSPWAAEDWAGGPWALAQTASAYLHVLRRIRDGRRPVEPGAVKSDDDRVVVDVFPATGWDRLLLSGYTAKVWTRPGTTPHDVLERAARIYRAEPAAPGVALVLGAGNVAAITALDILHKLYVEGQVVVAKMNPVNAYLRPHFESVFAEFRERGFVRFVDGGAAEGTHLVGHAGIDSLHITGSERTYDAIVWGTGQEAEARRRTDRPLVTKPFSSELGGVSPCIVVPGPWSAADFRYQAEHIVTSKMNNSGHNCIASQILVVPRGWPGTDRLLEEIRRVLRSLPARSDYYPGARERLAAVRETYPTAEIHGPHGDRILVPDVTGHDDAMLTTEVFASALGVVRLPGGDTPTYLLDAVEFANDVLPGTLGATMLIHPKTMRREAQAVHAAIGALRYGTVGVNCWSAVGFLLGYTPWGAFPGHTRQAIGSGTGFVHNAFMLEDVEKTVLRAPFAPMPRGAFTGSASLSPPPPYFATNRTGPTTIERLTRFTASPGVKGLPGIFASALRG
ncbi:aldehyde dehydrogenase family protein [Actinospica robiniae]|uniref:aldehyde dehydrogenase family protein n=1 Tax=Actinospica robiniae TaxID=304901 RepID=UPI001B7F9140|nr:aldehyde dehydrogenase family protein [Actinospica robiniae]